MGQEGKKIRGAMLQGDPQGSGVDRLGADLGEVPVQSVIEGLGSLQEIKQVGVVRPERRGENAPPGENKILGGHGPPVGPSGVRAEIEGVGKPVGRILPPRRHSRHGMKIVRIFRHQPLE